MPDNPRREAIRARSLALRDKATAFTQRLKDDRVKQFMRSSVFNHLDDVDKFFLGDATARSTQDIWEKMWLDSAEMILTIAEQGFQKFEEQVSRYGGPEKVRFV